MSLRVPLLELTQESHFGTLSKAMIAQRVWRRLQERAIEKVLLLAALASIAITAGIVGLLVYESFVFFQSVSLMEFFTDTQWTPLFADTHYGILPLVAGTFVTTAVALSVAGAARNSVISFWASSSGVRLAASFETSALTLESSFHLSLTSSSGGPAHTAASEISGTLAWTHGQSG